MTYTDWTEPTKTMTDFSDDDIFLDEVSEVDRATIHDWFDTMTVCDDDNFPRYFKRVQAAEYPRYLQLMRIQPGVAGSSYDWMVQDYHAAINRVQGSTTNKTENTKEATANGSSSTEETTGTTYTAGTKNTVTLDTKQATSGSGTEKTTDEKTGTDTLKIDGSNTGTQTIDETDATSGDIVTDYGTNGIVDTKNITGGWVDATTGSDTHSTVTTGHDDHKEAAKVMPMDTNGGAVNSAAGDDNVDNLTVTFNSSPSSIGQTNNHSHGTTDITDTHGTDNARTYNSYGETNTRKGQQTQRYSGYQVDRDASNGSTETTDETQKTTYGSIDTVNRTTQNSQDVTNTGTTTTENTGTDTTDVTRNITGSNEGTTNEKETGTGEGTTEQLGRSESNGRHEDPAAILSRAVDFVESTSAWIWFSERLLTCFYTLYDF